MNKMKLIMLTLASVICMLMNACGKELKIEVIDEEGVPISGADIKIDYVDIGPPKIVNGVTNAQGVFISRGEKVAHRVELFVTKDGYYTSKFRHKYANALPNTAEGVFKLTLRKKGKPSPMYAKKVNMIFPSVGDEYGFDFEKGDWVKPHGKGEISDVYFLAEKTVKSRFNRKSRLKVIFPNGNDGIIIDKTWVPGSVYQQVKRANIKAPYERKIEIKHTRSSNKMNNLPPAHNYVFRVRSKAKKNGENISANYGRIFGGFFLATGFTQEDKCAVRFMYFFNPKPNDTNLEFDRKLNLFKNLKREEFIPEREPAMGKP